MKKSLEEYQDNSEIFKTEKDLVVHMRNMESPAMDLWHCSVPLVLSQKSIYKQDGKMIPMSAWIFI